jgi:hypothetical protein
MPDQRKDKAYILGLSIGTFWLIVASTGFSIPLLLISGVWPRAEWVILFAAVVLIAAALRLLIQAAKLPKAAHTEARRQVGRKFAGIVIAEILLIVLVNGVAFYFGLISWLIPLDLLIVGLHFFPLARWFGVPRYHVLGALFCLVSILTLILVPSGAAAGPIIARYLISSLGCAASAWLISVGNMLELQKLLSVAG